MSQSSGIAHLFRSLTGRLVAGVLVAHAILIPLLFAGVLYIVREGYQTQFIEQARSYSHLLAILASKDIRMEPLQALIDETLLSGNIAFVEVIDDSGKVVARGGAGVIAGFREDFFFNQHGDSVYFISLPIHDAAGANAMLRIGYDEIPTRQQIDLAELRALYLAAGYLSLVLFLVFFGGRTLKLMRQKLVAQASVLEHQALHDALSGLPNRALLHDRLHQMILTAQRDMATFSILLMDLDRFKEVNDTLGHQAGDVILQQTAFRLREVVRESDTVARLGGDEFAMVLPGADASDAIAIAEKILKALQEPFKLDNRILHIGASLGVVLFPVHGGDVVNLLRRADVAMYAAKRAGGGLVLYDPSLDQHSLDRLTLAAELRQGVGQGEIEVYYQPKVDLRSGGICGVEALARWQHPRRGLVLPEEFIPVAERTGIINALTLHVLDVAVRQCYLWHCAGWRISMAVNLSPLSLLDAQLAERVRDILHGADLPSSFLILEITEEAIMAEGLQSQETLLRLAAIGVGITIDDFGTGYSSLGRLKKLPVSEIKIDKSFVIDMLVDGNDAAIVQATIDLARNLGLRVVGEGVETQEHQDKLSAFGCDMAQGYHISRPLPAHEIQRLFMADHGRQKGG